jgi:hypothetical protein
MQGEGNFVGVRGAPAYDALELYGIVSDGADFHQLGFNDLWVSHRTLSSHLMLAHSVPIRPYGKTLTTLIHLGVPEAHELEKALRLGD